MSQICYLGSRFNEFNESRKQFCNNITKNSHFGSEIKNLRHGSLQTSPKIKYRSAYQYLVA